jgi:hypothetical protein
MKKLFLIVIAVLLQVALQSCAHLSNEPSYIKHFAKLAKENPGSFIKHGYIGINIKLNDKGEIEIIHVADDSAAKKEGIKPGDIILEIDSIPVTNKYQAFKIYDSKYPGDFLTFVLKRRNELLNKRINLKAFYTPTVFYVLYEKVYKDIPIRLAIIPTPISLPSSLEEGRNYFKSQMELKRYFEGGMLKIFRGHENFAVIDRLHTEKVLDEMKFQQSGLVKDESRIKIGQMLGATHLLLVNRSWELRGENEALYAIWMDLIEVESNKKIATSMMGSEKEKLGKEYVDYMRTSDIRNDLRAYFLKRHSVDLNRSESDAIKAFESITNKNYKDSETTESVFRRTVIPKYADFLSAMKSIDPVTEDVKALHKLYIAAISLQYEAFQKMLEASETNNESMYSEANNKMVEGRQLMEHSKRQFEDLVAKNISRFNDKN